METHPCQRLQGLRPPLRGGAGDFVRRHFIEGDRDTGEDEQPAGKGFQQGHRVAQSPHSVTHASLTSLSDRDALRELVHSRRAFERGLGHPVPWIAYPFGDYDSRIERLARRAGYVLGVTTEHGIVQSARRPLALTRLRILDSTGVAGLAAMLRG